jgi:hypothetical protein
VRHPLLRCLSPPSPASTSCPSRGTSSSRWRGAPGPARACPCGGRACRSRGGRSDEAAPTGPAGQPRMSGATARKPAAASAWSWCRQEYQDSGKLWHKSTNGPLPCLLKARCATGAASTRHLRETAAESDSAQSGAPLRCQSRRPRRIPERAPPLRRAGARGRRRDRLAGLQMAPSPHTLGHARRPGGAHTASRSKDQQPRLVAGHVRRSCEGQTPGIDYNM